MTPPNTSKQGSQKPEPKQHPLEKVVDALKKAGIKDIADIDSKIYNASLISLVDSLYDTVRSEVAPSPLFAVKYDESNNNISFKELKGYAAVPKRGLLDVEVLDLVLAFNLRSTPMLLMGDTGAGKTFTMEQYLKTMHPPDHYQVVRLSGNPLQNNLLSFFVKTKVVEGNFENELNKEAVDNTAAVVIDEFNRGDSQSSMQILDGNIDVAGLKKISIGPYIPDVTDKGLKKGARKMKTQVYAASNPPSNQDAKFTQTRDIDAAQLNRVIKIDFPNSVKSFGTSLWLADKKDGKHDRLKTEWSKCMAKYTGVDFQELYDSIEDKSWEDVLAYTMDPKRTDKQLYYTSNEFGDMLVQTLSGKILDSSEMEREIIADWNDVVASKYKINFTTNTTIDPQDKDLLLLEETVNFPTTVVPRDIPQLLNLADIMSTVKELKTVFKGDSPLDDYMASANTLRVDDVATAACILAGNKKAPTGKDTVDVINTILKEYTDLVTDYERILYDDNSKKFSLDNTSSGIKFLAIQKALYSSRKGELTAEGIISETYNQMNTISQLDNSGSQIRKLMVLRSLADLSTFAGFVDQYRTSINNRLGSLQKEPDKIKPKEIVGQVLGMLQEFYIHKRDEIGTLAFEDIYVHRMPRTLG